MPDGPQKPMNGAFFKLGAVSFGNFDETKTKPCRRT